MTSMITFMITIIITIINYNHDYNHDYPHDHPHDHPRPRFAHMDSESASQEAIRGLNGKHEFSGRKMKVRKVNISDIFSGFLISGSVYSATLTEHL